MNQITKATIAGLLLITALSTSCRREERRSEPAEELPVVETTTIAKLQPVVRVVLPGELKPWNKTRMFPKVKGYAAKIHADRGSRIRKGSVLATLEAPELIASLNHARAQVSSADAAYLERASRHKASKSTYQRMLQASQTKGAISDNELDIAYAAMMSDSAMMRASVENLLASRAQLSAQQELVEYLTVRAPFDGLVTERNLSPGDLVGPETTGKPMFVLEDHSTLRLTVAIPENLTNSIAEGSSVTFTTQADPQTSHHAVFGRSSNSLQESNRTMPTEFDFDNKMGTLKAGMYAEVQIPVKRNTPSLFVNKASVLQSTEGVFVVKITDRTAEWVGVEKGNTLDSLVEVFGPIRDGDVVVKEAHEEIRNGKRVKVRS